MNKIGLCTLTALLAIGCGREGVWDEPIGSGEAYGLRQVAAVIDPGASRVLVMEPQEDLTLALSSLPLNDGYVAAATTPDHQRLLLLSRGVVPRQRADDDQPMLQVLNSGDNKRLTGYGLTNPVSGLAIDPASDFAVLYSKGEGSFVENRNELAVVSLDSAPSETNPGYVTLRSFGGEPSGFTFTPQLLLPGGPRRLLVVQTDRDVAIVDLDDVTTPEITVPVSTGSDALVPEGVAISDGAPDRDDDARIAIRLKNDSNVIVIDLLPVSPDQSDKTPQSFRAAPNVVFVGGVPSDIAFVKTDGGLRLAALIGTELTLVDPATGLTNALELGGYFDRLSLVTDVVGATGDGGDVALLWSESSSDIAFVALGSTVGTPYKSVELLPLDSQVVAVQSVGGDNPHLRILHMEGDSFFVLDLLSRTAAPVQTTYSAVIATAPNGSRAWVRDDKSLAQLDLNTLHPQNLELPRSVDFVFDVERPSGSALIAIHQREAFGATVLDANKPSLAHAKHYAGLLLGGFE